MSTELYEAIIEKRFVYGTSTEKIAKEIGKGETSVRSVVYAFESVRDEDWNRAENIMAKSCVPMALFEWAAEKLGKELPESIYAAERSRKKKEQKETANPDPQAAPVSDHWDEEKALLTTLCMELKRSNELMEQLYDVVFPKWAGDVKDNVNVNCDVINQSLKRVEDKLERITINTRRKGL